jgi:hypothetical protein
MFPPVMKTILSATAALVVLLAGPSFARDRPALDIDRAVAIAQGSLEERDLASKLYIESVQLEISSLVKGYPYWMIRWSEKIPAETPKKTEIGMKVYMDGRATRIIE